MEINTDWAEIKKMVSGALVDTTEKPPLQPTAISCGYKGQNLIPLATYGNFSCITGIGKSYKTFFKSAMIAAYIGGQSNNYFPDMAGHDNKGKAILDFDTEQSKWMVYNNARRVEAMVGARYDLYQPYTMRHLSAKQRLNLIEYLLFRSENPIGLVSIDGIADLLTNINDPEQSNNVVEKLMKWSADLNCHIVTVLHRNISKDNPKPTGWIGSSVTKKAETVFALRREESTGDPIIMVQPEYTRNISFEEFTFTVKNGLPTTQQIDIWD